MTRFDLPRRRPRPRLTIALALACILALGACAGSPPMRLHTLEAAPGATRDPRYAGPPLQVRAVAVPAALDRAELLREVAPGQFEVREFDHWAAPLPQLARKALSENLAARLPAARLAFPGASWPQPLADLNVDILSFETRAGVATMQAGWSLRPRLPAATATATAPRGGQLRLTTAANDSASGTSQAFAALLGRLADAVVADLERP